MKRLVAFSLVSVMFLTACSDVKDDEKAKVEYKEKGNIEQDVKTNNEKNMQVNTKPYGEHFAKEVYREGFNEDKALSIVMDFIFAMESGNESRIHEWLGSDIGLTEKGIYDKNNPQIVENPANYKYYTVNKVVPLENGFQVVYEVGEKHNFMFLTFEENKETNKLVKFSMYYIQDKGPSDKNSL